MQSFSSVPPPPHQPVPVKSLSQAEIVGSTVQGLLVLVFPLCLLLGTVVFKKYRLASRAAVLRQQVEMLERLWQMSPKK
ncbi:MAG: hypothetical protein AB1589_09425 [Cyanobacteriota bacterium]